MPDGIHVVSFDIPFPPDYGGVIDVYFKAKALAEAGLEVYLHCFVYGREPQKTLQENLAKVFYYPRRLSPKSLVSKLPFIVKTRKDKELLKNLGVNDWPILFEGLHTCGWLDDPKLNNRLKLVRAHNVEHEYYAQLAKSEPKLFRKKYLQAESRKLRSYERILNCCQGILAIGQADADYFQKKYGKTELIYPFRPEVDLSGISPEQYAFYHGNLEVAENQEALRFLIQKVFQGLGVSLVVAGKGSESDIAEFRQRDSYVDFYLNPTDNEMNDLARRAALHVLPTFQPTGFKLKLLYSLLTEVPVITNSAMIAGTGLGGLTINAESAKDFQRTIKQAAGKSLTEEQIKNRKAFLQKHYSNGAQAKKIVQLLG